MKRYLLICCTVMLCFFGIPGARAENPSDLWAKIPTKIVEALDDSLRSMTPSSRVSIDEIDGDKAALILDSGAELKTVCALEKDEAGKWRVVGVNDGIVPMRLAEDDAMVTWWDGALLVGASISYDGGSVGGATWTFGKTPDGADLTLQDYIDVCFTEQDSVYVVYPHMGGYTVGRVNHRGDTILYDRTLVFDIPNLSFDAFDTADFFAFVIETLEARSDAPETPLPVETSPLPPPQKLTLPFNAAEAIYAGPSETYVQTDGKEKEAKDWTQVFGRDGDYALVQYNIGKEQNRFGYIPVSGLPETADIPNLLWASEPCVTTISLSLMDDPLRSRHAVGILPAGTNVTKLAAFGEALSYVEAEIDGKPARGFVLSSFVVPEADAPEEADEVKALATYWFDRYGDTFSMNLALQNKYSPYAISEKKRKELEAEQFDVILKALPVIMEQGLTAETLVNEYSIHTSFGEPNASQNAWFISISGSRFIPEPMETIFLTLEEDTHELLFLQVGGNG